MNIRIRTVEPSTAATRSASTARTGRTRRVPRAARAGLALAAVAVVSGTGLAMAPAASAATGPSSAPFTPEQNSPDAWCADGFKVEVGGEQFTYQLAQAASILVIKAATTNYWWTDAEAGTYTVPGKNAISHVIVCPAQAPSDEPSQPSDEPSQPTDESTEPSQPAEPTQPTQPAEAPSPTTTPAPETEVSSVSSEQAEAESSSAPQAETATQLAHTGGSDSRDVLLTGLGLSFLAAGAVALRLGRSSRA